ncbi:HPP family protein [Psychrosphaera sp. F3M07]|uniref:HPP family protein n=1 Tax=Psychrosphaera sp. F3M07 TaxID=2841560 RepID=UPI001C0A5EAB|nr:HPP family protein [Psychrosphaera sp. F3M07]MBU2916361.1 HPP family protein [Psychrosphaera sp. F3M07]
MTELSKPLSSEITLKNFFKLIGCESSNTTFVEKVISGIGATVGIFLSYIIASEVLNTNEGYILLTAMGASSVLVFALPHGSLSQPWSVFGGHIISALIGYFVFIFVPEVAIASAIAVGTAVIAMYCIRCLHPPGGATALFIVLAGHSPNALNISALAEILVLNVTALLVTGLIFNNLFEWRRYPAYLYFRNKKTSSNLDELTHEDFSSALLQLDSYVDVSTEELALIFDLAITHAKAGNNNSLTFLENHYYSNAQLGRLWSVKEIISLTSKMVIYKVVAGDNISLIGKCSLKEFGRWAKLEVELEKKSWIKKAA